MEGVIRARAGQLGIPYDEMETQYLAAGLAAPHGHPGRRRGDDRLPALDAGRNISGQSLGVDGNVEAL